MAEPNQHRVLARAYRPQRLSELIGQDVLVQTLRNAIQNGRIAQAFMLTGIRGVGKTTTARIIAKSLNCTGPDGTGNMTPEPCGVCEQCTGIDQGRHLDVLEMDAASHTGINDVRELIETVRYAPTSGRYKVYIIDEVHMLSIQAFNGLLKTLEEPPPHACFVFATTEIRKVPVTILSRCQRFDLRRVPSDVLVGNLDRIAKNESLSISDDALEMIARCAEGSVRDSLSLLDQAAAMHEGAIDHADIARMIGLGDQDRIVDLFKTMLAGDVAKSLEVTRELYELGADPVLTLQDVMNVCHETTLQQSAPQSFGPMSPALQELSGKLSIPVLTRQWQMLLTGLQEVRSAPDPYRALQMLIVRLCHVSDLPPPGKLLEALSRQTTGGPSASPSPQGHTSGGHTAQATPAPVATQQAAPSAPALRDVNAETISSLADLISRLKDAGELQPAIWLHESLSLVSLESNRLSIHPVNALPEGWRMRLSDAIHAALGYRMGIDVSVKMGDTPLAEQEKTAARQALVDAEHHPDIAGILGMFPGSTLIELRDSAVRTASPKVNRN